MFSISRPEAHDTTEIHFDRDLGLVDSGTIVEKQEEEQEDKQKDDEVEDEDQGKRRRRTWMIELIDIGYYRPSGRARVQTIC